MTFEEAKSLLQDMRAAKRRANALKARIAHLESDSDSIRSSLGGDGTHGGITQSRVEQLALRIEAEREKHMAALEAYFELEDKLAEAIDTLDPTEKEVIVSFYMDGNRNWEVGQIVGYDLRTIIRKKNSAIKKIADKL